MNDTPINTQISFPALKGRQGDRTIYQIMVQNSYLVAPFFDQVAEEPTQKSQRELSKNHAKEIGDYINDNPEDYVLGSLTYSVDVECAFTPSMIHESVGVLSMPLNAFPRCLDGQHRRKGLIQAVSNDPALAEEFTSVLIYVEPDLDRRRQMFSDMNSTPKVVAKALNVSFDTRDPFARAAKVLEKEHAMLAGHTETVKARITAGSDNWYTLGAIFDALKRLQVGPNGRVRNANQFSEEAILRRGEEFLDLLNSARPEFDILRAGDSVEEMRNKNILLSSTTLKAIAGALYLRLKEDGDHIDLRQYAGAMARIDFTPGAEVWIKSGFVAPGKSTPSARNQEVLKATESIAEMLKG